jgi:glycerol-3-phosphate dehydrogenase
LLTVTGGKWTTYRKMAEETIDQAILLGQLDERPCVTEDLNIHGYHRNADQFGDLAFYGADAQAIGDLMRQRPETAALLHPAFTTREAEVLWAVRREMARTVEDFLARRTRALLLDARASMDMAPRVAALMAAELGRDRSWQQAQVRAYQDLARDYLPV